MKRLAFKPKVNNRMILFPYSSDKVGKWCFCGLTSVSKTIFDKTVIIELDFSGMREETRSLVEPTFLDLHYSACHKKLFQKGVISLRSIKNLKSIKKYRMIPHDRREYELVFILGCFPFVGPTRPDPSVCKENATIRRNTCMITPRILLEECLSSSKCVNLKVLYS